jgi:hypothetical protein
MKGKKKEENNKSKTFNKNNNKQVPNFWKEEKRTKELDMFCYKKEEPWPKKNKKKE